MKRDDEQLNKTQSEMPPASPPLRDEAFADPALASALGHFRRSVLAWSDAELHRRRPILVPAARPLLWRHASAWALGVVLLAGSASAGLYQHHRTLVLAEQAKQRELQRQRLLAEEHAREAEDLLAKVDSDVSREVPAAMEPLAQFMTEDNSQ